MAKVIDWFRKLFGYLGEIWQVFRNSSADQTIVKALNDTTFQRKAMEIVKELALQDLTPAEKEARFNELFNQFCDLNGYSVQASVVNTLRELAYSAYQIKYGSED